MLDSVRIKTTSEEAARGIADDLAQRFHTQLHHEGEADWEVRVESESEDDLPDLIGMLLERLRAPASPIELLIDGVPYTPGRGD